ncbi:MAG: hypothetical protein IKA99_02190 [Clostridia bacterium]|nr:hypothetical protein [Clostridia bacterium]
MLDILEQIKKAYEKGDFQTKLAIAIIFLIDDMINAKDNIKEIQTNQKNFALVLEQHEKSIQEIEKKLKDYEPKKDI